MRCCENCGQSKPRPLGPLCEFCAPPKKNLAPLIPMIFTVPVDVPTLTDRVRPSKPTKGISSRFVETGLGRRGGDGLTLSYLEALPYAQKACDVVGVDLGLMQSRAHPLGISMRRWQVFYLLRRAQGLGYPSIGRVLRKNHTSCIHGVREIEKRCKDDVTLSQLRAKYKALVEKSTSQEAAA